MEWIAIIVILILGVAVCLCIWLILHASNTERRLEEFSHRLRCLETEAESLRAKTKPEPTPQPEPTTVEALKRALEKQPERAPQTAAAPPLESIPAMLRPAPPPPPPPPPPILAAGPSESVPQTPWPRGRTTPAIDWEQFMGVKLFAWLGGLALFLGVAFFVKYSFDNNLVPPKVRMAIGFVTGLGLLAGGLVMSRKNYAALSQTLCATGVVILYAVTFACRSIYHFKLFGPLQTFLLMTLITTAAFLLAVRLNALVVAILGMFGGFLTPILLSTGVDNPGGLFGYIAILDAGLIVVALHRRWFFLTALAAAGTAVMQIGWMEKFFVREKYFAGDKIFIALAVLLGFSALFLAGRWWPRIRKPAHMEDPLISAMDSVSISKWVSGSTLGLVAVAYAFTAWFLDFEPLARRPWLMFGFVFLLDLVIVALVFADENISPAQSVSGFAVFGLLALWTAKSLSNELLNAALAFYFIFAVLHSGLPALLQRRRGGAAQHGAIHIFPILALALVLVPIFKLAEVSFIVWPFILLADLLAIALAVITATLLPVLGALLLTLAAIGALLFKIPSNLTGLPVPFFLLGAFVIFFVVVGIWLVKKFRPEALQNGFQFSEDLAAPGDLAGILPACSIVLPFLLLIMATLRLSLLNPSPVFGLALLLVVLLLGVTKLFSLDWMPAIGLACVTALECAWHFSHFEPSNPKLSLNPALTWYLIFFGAFALFPFLFFKQFSGKVVPWASAAMSGPPHFFLIHRLLSAEYHIQFMGLLPAAFAIPGLLSLVVVLKKIPAAEKSRLAQLAWFGGVSLFFITLIFPMQFERQWITLGWALEGAALLWLFHRVPHPGLRLTGVALLAAAFVRLALNPAVLAYHARAATPILNWYLYAYGIVTVCLFTGARLLAPPRNLLLGSSAPPLLAALGTVLGFLLLNIEIADFFSHEASTLTFEFGGNFAREMTYSIAWAFFALALLITGMVKKIRAPRYAALGLLSVTLFKLFFHDLAQLGQLYRIGAFIGVATIAMLASFAYQRFFAATTKNVEQKNEPVP